jgi:methionyl-tRNA formyltransferase
MIYIITQRDPFFIDSFLHTFDKYDIPFVVFDMPNFKQGKKAGIKRAIRLYGWLGFGRLITKIAPKIFSSGFRNATEIVKVKKMQDLHDIFSSLNDEDVVLSLSAPERIPVEIMNSKTLKLNFHCGELPTYAGMMPIFWQVHDGKKDIIITLHHMAKDIDEGSIISETKLPVSQTFFKLSQKAKEVSAHIFAKTIMIRKEIKTTNIRQNKVVQLRKFPSKSDVAKVKPKIKMI